MTRLQKIIVCVAIAIATALFVNQVRVTRAARADVAKLQAQQANWTNQIARLQAALAAKDDPLSATPTQNSAPGDSSNESELLKLRAEVTRAHSSEGDLAMLRHLLAQSSQPFREWKTNELLNAGRAEPISAVETFLFLSQQADPTELKSGLVGDDVDPPDPDETEKFLANRANFDGFGREVSAVKVISQNWLSPDRVQVQVLAEMGGTGVGIAVPLTLRNVNGEWKIMMFNNRDATGKIQEVSYFEKKTNL